MKKYNFNAGPSILPREVIEATASACLEFEGSGLSLMEISHRAKNFQPVVDEAVALFKELLQIPEGYSVLFLGGGASLEFCMIPYNLLEKKAAYLNTGVWASKAEKEARLFGEVVEVASSKDRNFTYIPKGFTIPADADYLHITSNNTIYGTELREDLDSPIPVVADMSSDIFSRPVEQVWTHLRRCTEESEYGRCDLCDCEGRSAGQSEPSHPHHAGLSYACEERKHVQHTSRGAHLLRSAEPEVDKEAGWSRGYGEESHRALGHRV